LNGDGLTDLVTGDGFTKKITWFVRFRDSQGQKRLKKNGVLTELEAEKSPWYARNIEIVDWNRDALNDLVVNVEYGKLDLLLNRGTKENPLFPDSRRLKCFGEETTICRHGPNLWAGNMDADDYPDILVYMECATFPFYSHAALEMEKRPEFALGALRKERAK